MNYYNDNDPKSAAWLRELIKEGLIPNGHVDERSITDVSPADLGGFTQCHFFAGIGGWSLALRLAGWPEDMPIWTGSCPCQPFSSAGKQRGADDERHLWPALFDLIRERKPECVFGEQVANSIGHGWLDGISSDLESEGYTCGAVVLGAHSIGAPHIRQRLYWVADSNKIRLRAGRDISGESSLAQSVNFYDSDDGLVNSDSSTKTRLRPECIPMESKQEAERSGDANAWTDSEPILCADGKSRRIKPGLCPLANGVSGRVGLLRGYGNAIVPQVAAEFIKAFIECRQDGAMNSV